MNLFIDSQIWLSLYTFSKDNLKEFGKLKKSIQNKEVAIFITNQVCEEVFRNRENKLKEVLKQTEKIQFCIPVLYQGYDVELSEFTQSFEKVKDINDKIQSKIEKDIQEQNLPQDKLIAEMFALSKILETSDPIIDKAVKRFNIIGNPPGKDGKYGDALTWETLLEKYPNKEDLFFISSDKDFKSVIDENRFNQFLKNEWEKRKKSSIFFYNCLSDFFSQNFKDIKLEINKKQEILIENLKNSASFSETHTIVATMSQYENWTIEQIEKIAIIINSNSQINKILKDYDIYSFLYKLFVPLLFEATNDDVISVQHKLLDNY